MSDKATALDLIEKVNTKIVASFNFHIKKLRDMTTDEKSCNVSIGFLDAIEQVHALLSLAKTQIEEGKDVSFETPEATPEAIAEESSIESQE